MEVLFSTLKNDNLSYDRLHDLIQSLDQYYVPRISDKVNLEKYIDKLIKNAIVIIACKESIDVGFVAFYANDQVRSMGYLSSIGLYPEFQGTGLAKTLLDKFEKNSLEKGMKSVALEVSKDNIKAQRFYLKHAYFQFSSSKKSYYFRKNLV